MSLVGTHIDFRTLLHLALATITLWFGSVGCTPTDAAEMPPLPQNLAETLDLYLSSEASYRQGDLITKSHLEEFQTYLRRTQGPSAATNPRWLRLMLKDRDVLAQAFYNGGKSMLRQAVAAVGGYDQIHKLVRTPDGRRVIKQAVAENSFQRVVDAVTELAKNQVSDEQKTGTKKKVSIPNRIFTAADYIAAVEKFQAERTAERSSEHAVLSMEN